ncbi:M23 family metallopeptidase [Corynebacterium pacaense]|uniref:M23 family metallopeptidase n=1 Tax=Corynebacterium pacaense TaxID=1816684 RepID=UPI0009BB539C|nr:M23 family metallopeptidase [Corynebacterium pacaense]
MQEQTRRGGKHRKQTTSQTTKGRVALVAVATGAVSTAGAGGAVAASTQAENAPVDVNYQLASNDVAEFAGTSSAPQILSISEFKPVANLGSQLTQAIEFNSNRIQADLQARAPHAVKPAEGSYTSGFGARWGTSHNGVDIANAIGTPIVAVMDGKVIDAGPASGFGNWVRLRHEDGTITVYGHMETIDVAVGQTVTAGQKIAGMGSRGFSTGSHLHFEVHPAGQGPIDPAPWLAEHGIQL